MEDGHFLTSPFMAERYEIPISKEDFEAIKRSRLFLIDYMRMEESVLQILYSFQDFESFILDTALQAYLFPLSEYDFAQDNRVRANIRVLGLLNSVASFKDQFPRFKLADGKADVAEVFSGLWSRMREQSVSFNFFERLRNYAQHQTQPVSFVTIGGGWDKERRFNEHRASVFVNVQDVSSNRGIKSTEKDKYIEAFGEKADVGLIFRETSGCIGKLVKEIRTILSEDFHSSVDCYERALDTVLLHSEQAGRGTEVISVFNGQKTDEFSLFSEFCERSKKLNRTFLMENNHHHFISNRAFGHSNQHQQRST